MTMKRVGVEVADSLPPLTEANLCEEIDGLMEDCLNFECGHSADMGDDGEAVASSPGSA